MDEALTNACDKVNVTALLEIACKNEESRAQWWVYLYKKETGFVNVGMLLLSLGWLTAGFVCSVGSLLLCCLLL